MTASILWHRTKIVTPFPTKSSLMVTRRIMIMACRHFGKCSKEVATFNRNSPRGVVFTRMLFVELNSRGSLPALTMPHAPLQIWEPEMKWVRVEDRKPEHGHEVLLALRLPDICGYWIGEYDAEFGKFWETTECRTVHPTHWAPLVPPKAA